MQNEAEAIKVVEMLDRNEEVKKHNNIFYY